MHICVYTYILISSSASKAGNKLQIHRDLY